MAEPILKRMQRIVAAGLESATDAAERLNGGGMMRHAVREVEQAIDKLQKRRDAAKAQALQADWRQAAIRDQVAELARDARFAMDKGRDDLAEAALARQIDLEQEGTRLGQVQLNAEREAAQLQASIDELKARKAQMEHEHAALQAARRDASAAGGDPAIDRKVQRAEAAFERARRAAGSAPSAADAPAPGEVQELRAVRRDDEIATRLAALRGGPAPAAAARAGKRKTPA